MDDVNIIGVCVGGVVDWIWLFSGYYNVVRVNGVSIGIMVLGCLLVILIGVYFVNNGC